MTRPFICVGDSQTHGGVVVSGAPASGIDAIGRAELQSLFSGNSVEELARGLPT
ncbi:hypothetical protein ACFSHT_18690 [Paraburkholderia silviterrae]|uniref:hypothetical protein n=1 Tax=Paraburkholderia silviterrae TaxID=2528715 RepID=UPI0014047356|nr:hypothetical protein [Paraburkholderia silviterrae]